MPSDRRIAVVREFLVYELPQEIVLHSKCPEFGDTTDRYLVLWNDEKAPDRFWTALPSLGGEHDVHPRQSTMPLSFQQGASPGHWPKTMRVGEATSSREAAESSITNWLTSKAPPLRCFALLGVLRLLSNTYAVVVTAREQVAILGGSGVYTAAAVEFVCCGGETTNEDTAYLALVRGVLTGVGGFYFSYGWDLTRSLQSQCLERNKSPDSRFVFNSFLLSHLQQVHPRWLRPLVQGAVEQQSLVVSDRRFFLTLIARRSRYRVGPRFFRRGIDMDGRVANELECEQILWDAEEGVTRDGKSGGVAGVASFVMLRGSIPIFWGHEDSTAIRPKIRIDQECDPTYTKTESHFSDLLERYGPPIAVLNMVKQHPAQHAEKKLTVEFEAAIEAVDPRLQNGSCGDEALEPLIIYEKFDWATLEVQLEFDKAFHLLCATGRRLLNATGLFVQFWRDGGTGPVEIPDLPHCRQKGIARVNCVDCLDRTNLGMTAIAQEALRVSLLLLGCRPSQSHEGSMRDDWLNSPLPAVTMRQVCEMWGAVGDAVAVAYAGSPAMHRAEVTPSILERESAWCCTGATPVGDELRVECPVERPTPLISRLGSSKAAPLANTSLSGEAPDLLLLDKILKYISHEKGLKHLRQSCTPVDLSQCEFRVSKRSNVSIVVQRYLTNVFSDLDRQRGLYIFLGRFRPRPNEPSIWDMDVFLQPTAAAGVTSRSSLCSVRNGDALCGWVLNLCTGMAVADTSTDADEFRVALLESRAHPLRRLSSDAAL